MSIIEIEKSTAQKNLHKAPFQLRHGLQDHRLFTLPKLVELAQKMPRDRIEYNSGDLAIGQSAETTPRLSMPAVDVISSIENHNAWMVIKRVEQVEEYKALLTGFVDSLFDQAGLAGQKYSDLEGYIFVSSAHATTPFHVDAEENILVQIRGEKFVHIFDNEDRALISEEALEISPAKYRNQVYQDSFEEKAKVFTLGPGDGVHIPYLHPHWVRVADQYSVSMAMTWKTPKVIRANKLRLMNGTLRHFGLPQKVPGQSPLLDGAKVFAHDAARLMIDPLRKSEKARNMLRGLIYGKKANYYLDEPASKS